MREQQRCSLYHGSGYWAGLRPFPPTENPLALLAVFSGITNYEEYSLIQEVTEDKKEDGMGTLKKDRTLLLRDERKMEKLKAKLHTDDDCECELAKSSRSVVYISMTFMSYSHINEADSTASFEHVVYRSSLIYSTAISKFNEITTVIFGQRTPITFGNMQRESRNHTPNFG